MHAFISDRRCLTLCLASARFHFDGGTEPLEECSTEKSSTKSLRIVSVLAILISGTPASGLLIDRTFASLIARRAAKCSLTSIFLMSMMPLQCSVARMNGARLERSLEG